MSDDGMTFPIVDAIPVMLPPVNGDQQYREHYRIDAVEFDYFEERDAATEHDEHRLRQSILRRLDAPAQMVLDVGCGRAWVARELCPKNITVCSLDVSITNPRRALQEYPFPNHVAVVADAMALPFADNVFDCVIASEIIEHVQDPRGFVRELLRVLKPGGQLLVSTPYKEKLRYVLCVHCNQRTPLHAHLHSFDEMTLSAMLSPTQASVRWQIFGNKALLLLRTYVVLQFLPYVVWRLVDGLCNAVLKKPAHIIMDWRKSTVS